MRSIVFALALAVPCSAFAATHSTYTRPLTDSHPERTKYVAITFVNPTSQDREVVVGDTMFKIANAKHMSVTVPVGGTVRIFSTQNSKVNGQELMQISASDADRTVVLK
jgi:glycine cleavage system H lipoate-binding protein